jgi:hypothetical protein
MNWIELFRRIYEFGWIAVASAISSAAFNKWSSAVPSADYRYSQMAIDATWSFLLWLGLLSVPFWFINIPRFRYALFPHARIEGWWLQLVDNSERPWSLSHLSKNIGFGWTYSGYAYDVSLRAAANWQSSDIKLDDRAGFWLFKGGSHRLDGTGAPARTGNVLSVLYTEQYCEAFVSDPLAKLPGRIADLDYDDKPTTAAILLVRVTEDDWRKAGITKKSVKLRPDAMRSLIERMQKDGRWDDSDRY